MAPSGQIFLLKNRLQLPLSEEDQEKLLPVALDVTHNTQITDFVNGFFEIFSLLLVANH